MTKIKNNILLTRPIHDSNKMLNSINELGLKAIVEPLIDIKINQFSNNEIEGYGCDSLVVTSANAVRAISPINKPVYCIGNNTFSEAQNKGFKKAINIDGGVADLKFHLKNNKNNKFLYLSGDVVTDELNIKGLNLSRKIVYNSHPRKNLSTNCITHLEKQQIKIIAFYSTRTAKIFNDLASKYNYTNIYAVCISKKCSLALNKLNFRKIFISNRPNGESMLELIANISFNL